MCEIAEHPDTLSSGWLGGEKAEAQLTHWEGEPWVLFRSPQNPKEE